MGGPGCSRPTDARSRPGLPCSAVRRRASVTLAVILIVSPPLAVLTVPGCTPRAEPSARIHARGYSPLPLVPRLVLVDRVPDHRARVPVGGKLVEFLLGTEPAPPPALVTPTGLASDGPDLLICDTALGRVFRWDGRSGILHETCVAEPRGSPSAIEIGLNGDRLVGDAAASAVLRFDRAGRLLGRYELAGTPFRPGGMACVAGEVWVSNVAAHRLEVFDAATGRHLRSLGSYGDGPAQFALPLGLACTPEGDVCVVDVLNNRVQVLDSAGNWLRDIGRPVGRVGHLGRPKDAAVGPDGTVFVTDVAPPGVRVFDADGRPILAFGESESEAGSLRLPNGIAVLPDWPMGQSGVPAGFSPAYYVAIAEQLVEPGVRIYAWVQEGVAEALERPVNPHWTPDRCGACHRMEAGRPLAVAAEAVDSLCLACHDGRRASAEPHPVGRLASEPPFRVPDDWPLIDDRLGCLTCHHVRQHCDANLRRPTVNPGFVREYDAGRPLDFCLRCHFVDESWNLNPHRQLDAAGQVRGEVCLVCHTGPLTVPPDAARRFEPKLHDASSGLCLRCHAQHWDVTLVGHVERPVPETIRRRLLAREALGTAGRDGRETAMRPSERDRQPAKLPLADGRVACFTCHNPHQAGLFPAGSELDTRAKTAAGAAAALRLDLPELCQECHAK